MPDTRYKTVLVFGGNTNCRFYDTPTYQIEVTLEQNISSARKMLRSAISDNRQGIPNSEYLKWCLKNYKKAKELIRNAELI